MTTIYGIKNCDTMKKAMQWLDANNIEYTFHDYKKQSLDEKILNTWLKQVGWEVLLNKRGTTFRKLPEDVKNSIDETSAKQIMLDNLSIIKRPVLDIDGKIAVGFKAEDYVNLFS